MHHHHIHIGLLFMFTCCNQPQESGVNHQFNIPILIQPCGADPAIFLRSDSLQETWIHNYGKFRFRDTLNLCQRQRPDSSYMADIMWEQSRSGMDDTLATDGFQLFVDYETSISPPMENQHIPSINYYPVYV